MAAASTIARLIRTRFNTTEDQHIPLKDAITKVLTDITFPLELKVFNK